MLSAPGRQHARVAIGLVLVALIACHLAGLVKLPGLAQLERVLYDARVVASGVRGVDERVVIVDIDEASLAEIGRWPWRRDLVARLIDRIFAGRAPKVVGFDIVFAEPDPGGGLAVLEMLAEGPLKQVPAVRAALAEMRPGLDYDAQLVRALQSRPVVLGVYFSSGAEARRMGALPTPALASDALAGRDVPLTVWAGYGGNLDAFQVAAKRAGHFNAISDDDGITRRVPLIVEHAGQYYEALALALVRRTLGDPPLALSFSALPFGRARVEAIGAGRLHIPVDPHLAARVPFRGPAGAFRYVSAADVLAGRASADAFADRIVIVGTSAPGLYDLRATPVGSVFPGVEIHANLVAGMLDRQIKSAPVWLTFAAGVLTVLLGVALALLLPRFTPSRTAIAAAAALAIVALAGYLFWEIGGLVVPLAPLVALILALFFVDGLAGYFFESRAKRQFASLFGQYVPPALVERMARDPHQYNTEPRNETLTILFADLRGFTTIAETLGPADVRRFLNDYLTEMSQVIHQHQGTVDKYIGDAIMAFWGAPMADPDHARHAVLAAMRMQKVVREVEASAGRAGLQPVAVGVGINTGLVSVGDMGSRLRRSYTVLGDPVNLASRLESLTKYYGVGIVIGERTRQLVPDLVCRELDRVRVKGRGEAVSIYEPLGFADEVRAEAQAELSLWGHMLRAYRAGRWDEAELAVMNLQRLHSHQALYELYLSRIVRQRAEPASSAAAWDGVTVFDRK